MEFNFDTLNRLHELSGLEHCLLSYLVGSLKLLSLDNNDCDDVTLNRLRSLARGVCEELRIKAYL